MNHWLTLLRLSWRCHWQARRLRGHLRQAGWRSTAARGTVLLAADSCVASLFPGAHRVGSAGKIDGEESVYRMWRADQLLIVHLDAEPVAMPAVAAQAVRRVMLRALRRQGLELVLRHLVVADLPAAGEAAPALLTRRAAVWRDCWQAMLDAGERVPQVILVAGPAPILPVAGGSLSDGTVENRVSRLLPAREAAAIDEIRQRLRWLSLHALQQTESATAKQQIVQRWRQAWQTLAGLATHLQALPPAPGAERPRISLGVVLAAAPAVDEQTPLLTRLGVGSGLSGLLTSLTVEPADWSRRYWQRYRRRRDVLAAAWGGLCILVAAAWSYDALSMQEQMQALQRTMLPTEPAPAESRLQVMAQRVAILDAQNLPQAVPGPVAALRRKTLRDLRAGYVSDYARSVANPLDGSLDRSLMLLADVAAPRLRMAYVQWLLWRISVWQAAGAAQADARQLRATAPGQVLAAIDPDRSADNSDQWVQGFVDYAFWVQQPQLIRSALEQDRQRLNYALLFTNHGLNWLRDWLLLDPKDAASATALPAGAAGGEAEAAVDPLFTLTAWERLQRLLQSFDGVLADDADYQAARDAFTQNYRRDYVDAWAHYLAGVANAPLPKAPTAPEAAATLAAANSPYLRALHRAALQLTLPDALAQAGELPVWVREVRQYDCILTDFRVLDLASETAPSPAAAQPRWQQWLAQWLPWGKSAAAGVRCDGAADLHTTLADYRGTLRRLATRAASDDQAYAVVVAAYQAAAAGTQGENAAAEHFSVVARLGCTSPDSDRLACRLLTRQSRQVWRLLLAQAAGELQRQWRQEVTGAVQTMDEVTKTRALFGAAGKLRQFRQQRLTPFLAVDHDGAPRLRSLWEQSLPLQPAFLRLLADVAIDAVATAGDLVVEVAALPTDSNAEARIKPAETRLLVRCRGEYQQLVNRNYPVTRSVNWTPGECDEVRVQVGINGRFVEKRYAGSGAFPAFVEDFAGGKRDFHPGDFPADSAWLQAGGVTRIGVHFRLHGQEAVTRLTRNSRLPVPEIIIDDQEHG